MCSITFEKIYCINALISLTNSNSAFLISDGTWQAGYYLNQQQPLLSNLLVIAQELQIELNAPAVALAANNLDFQNSMSFNESNYMIRVKSINYVNLLVTLLNNQVSMVVQLNNL